MSFDDDDDSQSEWRRLVWGVLAATFAAYIAYDAFTTGEASYSYRGRPKPALALYGDGALAYGLQWTFLASFFHFHYFWAYFPRFQRIRSRITVISLVGFVVTTVYVVIYLARHPGQYRNA